MESGESGLRAEVQGKMMEISREGMHFVHGTYVPGWWASTELKKGLRGKISFR